LFGLGEFGRRGMAVEIHGMEDAAEIGGQVEAGEVGAALGGRGGGDAVGAVEVEEKDGPGGGGVVGVAQEGDVLVAEVAVEDAGIVEGADGVGDALEQVHEGGAAGGGGVEAVEFVAQVGEVGDVGGDEMAFAEAGALPAFDDGDGGGGADAGGAEGEGGMEGAFGLGAV
jgi:hypothetical protein